MSNNTINIDIDAMTEDFKAHCKVIKLGCEYPGYTGKEKYGIISDLSYEQITERYLHTLSGIISRIRSFSRMMDFRVRPSTVRD